MFYIDDSRIAAHDHEWVQDVLIVMIVMFCRMGIDDNLKNTKAMVCTPRFIWGKWAVVAYKWRATGKGVTFEERKVTWMSCTKCDVTVTTSYLKTHMAQIHGICVPQTRGVDKAGGEGNYVFGVLI